MVLPLLRAPERPHAHFPEPNHVTGIVILKSDVAVRRAFQLAARFRPVLAGRIAGRAGVGDLRACMVRAELDALAAELYG